MAVGRGGALVLRRVWAVATVLRKTTASASVIMLFKIWSPGQILDIAKPKLVAQEGQAKYKLLRILDCGLRM